MVFHWPLSDLLDEEWEELLVWHRAAVKRFEAMAKARAI